MMDTNTLQRSSLHQRVEEALNSEFITQVCFDTASSWAFETLIKYLQRLEDDVDMTDKFLLHVENAIKCVYSVNRRCGKYEKYLTNKYGIKYERYMFENNVAS